MIYQPHITSYIIPTEVTAPPPEDKWDADQDVCRRSYTTFGTHPMGLSGASRAHPIPEWLDYPPRLGFIK